MDISVIKNSYLQNIAKDIDSKNKPDNNLDIFEGSKFINTIMTEKNKNKNFTQDEYKQIVSCHLNELLSNYDNKYKDRPNEHFTKCILTCASTGIIGGTIGACKKGILGRCLNASIGGLIGLAIGLPLYFAYSIVKSQNNQNIQKEIKESEHIRDMIFKDFNELGLNRDERINILVEKCGYSYKNARKRVDCSM